MDEPVIGWMAGSLEELVNVCVIGWLMKETGSFTSYLGG